MEIDVLLATIYKEYRNEVIWRIGDGWNWFTFVPSGNLWYKRCHSTD